MWFEFTDDEPTKTLPQRLPVALKPNASFYTAFPDRKPNGDLIAAVDQAFPEKIGFGAFYEKGLLTMAVTKQDVLYALLQLR